VPPSDHFRYPADAPEARQRAYLSSVPVSPTQPERSLKAWNASEDPSTLQDASASQEMPHNTPTSPQTSHALQHTGHHTFWTSFAHGPLQLMGAHPRLVLFVFGTHFRRFKTSADPQQSDLRDARWSRSTDRRRYCSDSFLRFSQHGPP
jgi:hypothetical protein